MWGPPVCTQACHSQLRLAREGPKGAKASPRRCCSGRAGEEPEGELPSRCICGSGMGGGKKVTKVHQHQY